MLGLHLMQLGAFLLKTWSKPFWNNFMIWICIAKKRTLRHIVPQKLKMDKDMMLKRFQLDEWTLAKLAKTPMPYEILPFHETNNDSRMLFRSFLPARSTEVSPSRSVGGESRRRRGVSRVFLIIKDSRCDREGSWVVTRAALPFLMQLDRIWPGKYGFRAAKGNLDP